MKMTAFNKLRKFCLHYIKHNFEDLQQINPNFDNEVAKEIRKGESYMLDWFLSEVGRDVFLKKGICLESDWDEEQNFYTSIYKIGSTYIKTTFVDYKTDVVYEFVKRKKKHVIVYEWVSK